jgi:hypothetical protein
MPTVRPLTSLHSEPHVPLTPEPLEGRVLLSGVILDGTTTLGSADFNNDGADDAVLFARTRRARRILATSGIAEPRRSSLFFTDGVDGSVIGGMRIPGANRGAAPLLAVGDFNNDGLADLALASAGRSAGLIQILLGNGDGTFSRQRSVSAGSSLTSLTVADVNGDGNDDLVATGTVRNNGPQRAGGSGSTIMPDFRFELETAADLLLPPATGGGVTNEAGGATDGFGPSHPALVGDDFTGLIAPSDIAGTGSNANSGNGTLAGTFNPQPGVSVEAGGAVARIGGNFSDDLVDDGSTEVTVILLGNGDGTFNRADSLNR